MDWPTWGDHLTLEVMDSGLGFDLATVPTGHLGLHTMADRTRQMGGTIEILSRPGLGTTVRVTAPCCIAERMRGDLHD